MISRYHAQSIGCGQQGWFYSREILAGIYDQIRELVSLQISLSVERMRHWQALLR
jgi:hypothetical protein